MLCPLVLQYLVWPLLTHGAEAWTQSKILRGNLERILKCSVTTSYRAAIHCEPSRFSRKPPDFEAHITIVQFGNENDFSIKIIGEVVRYVRLHVARNRFGILMPVKYPFVSGQLWTMAVMKCCQESALRKVWTNKLNWYGKAEKLTILANNNLPFLPIFYPNLPILDL